MEKTAKEAMDLTSAASGKHHIGDFLPPKELTKFLAKVKINLIYPYLTHIKTTYVVISV